MTRGEIDIFGEKMTPDSYELKKNIGIVPQEIAVFDELTVRQNIDYFCGLYINDRKKRKKLVDKAIDFVGLEKIHKDVSETAFGRTFKETEHSVRDSTRT